MWNSKSFYDNIVCDETTSYEYNYIGNKIC